jgi:hypothetical protein
MARCSTRGPSAAAGGWRISPQGGSQGSEPVGRQSMDGLSTNPGARPRTLWTGCPQGAEAGWPSLWFLSLGHSRERNSPSARRTKAFALHAAKASPPSGLLRDRRCDVTLWQNWRAVPAQQKEPRHSMRQINRVNRGAIPVVLHQTNVDQPGSLRHIKLVRRAGEHHRAMGFQWRKGP